MRSYLGYNPRLLFRLLGGNSINRYIFYSYNLL